MRADPILREKWRVQRETAHKAGHDVARYLDLVEQNVKEWARANRIRLRYADVSQLPVRPLLVKEPAADYTTKRARRTQKTG